MTRSHKAFLGRDFQSGQGCLELSRHSSVARFHGTAPRHSPEAVCRPAEMSQSEWLGWTVNTAWPVAGSQALSPSLGLRLSHWPCQTRVSPVMATRSSRHDWLHSWMWMPSWEASKQHAQDQGSEPEPKPSSLPGSPGRPSAPTSRGVSCLLQRQHSGMSG